MLREEWRMHSTIFKGGRFATLPLVFVVLTLVAAGTLATLGMGLATLCTGVIALAFMLGLQTGTIGFESRDGVDNVMGEATFLLFSSRTLPLSTRTTMGAFLVKDMLYYAVLFIFPLIVGTYAGVQLATAAALTPDPASAFALSGLLLAVNTWVASTLVFLFGVSLVLVASGEVARNLRRGMFALLLVLVAVLVGAGSTALPNVGLVIEWITPPFSLGQLGLVAGATVLVSVVGVLRFSPTGASVETKPRNEFAWLHAQLGGQKRSSLVAKMVMDVHRSSGGVGKLLVSSAIILTAVYVVLEALQQWLPLMVSPGIVFSAFLSVTAVPTYIWLTQLDDVSTYQFYPISIKELFAAKAHAFVLLEMPVAIAYYAFMGLVLQPQLLDLVVGGVLLAGLLLYLFGVTVYLTGLKPNEALFDSVVFTKFTLAGMVVLVPVLMAGLFLPTVTPLAAVVLMSGAVIGGGVGVLCYRRGVAQWTRRLSVGQTLQE